MHSSPQYKTNSILNLNHTGLLINASTHSPTKHTITLKISCTHEIGLASRQTTTATSCLPLPTSSSQLATFTLSTLLPPLSQNLGLSFFLILAPTFPSLTPASKHPQSTKFTSCKAVGLGRPDSTSIVANSGPP